MENTSPNAHACRPRIDRGSAQVRIYASGTLQFSDFDLALDEAFRRESGVGRAHRAPPQYRHANDGILCVTTDKETTPDGLWRDKNKCPYANDAINGINKNKKVKTSWDGWHAFYISHDNRSTWYLHAKGLKEDIANLIKAQGYANVTKGTRIAEVGHWGLGANPFGIGPSPRLDHLHFEIRMNADIPLDPYGDGISNILWEILPP